MEPPYRIQTISQFHELRDRPEPAHPLISILNVTGTRLPQDAELTRLVFDFYTIAFNHLDDRESAWVHAYLHRKEGDLTNADYWYRRANQRRPTVSLQKEWTALVDHFLHG